MLSFKNADAGVIVDQLIKTIQKERDYLSEIDGKIGDGDHGINMNKGFTMCEKKLEGTTYNLSEGLTTLGETHASLYSVALALPLAYFSLIRRKEASEASVAVLLLLYLLSAEIGRAHV